MKYTISLCFFIILLLNNIIPCYSFDFKNIIFGNQDNNNNNNQNEGILFGHNLPANLRNKKPVNQDCINGYLCPDTNKCVNQPFQCPCRLATDIKCQLGKDWYTCIRGNEKCEEIIG
ncbi:unnamed protein product [Cunninghamella echinulata]